MLENCLTDMVNTVKNIGKILIILMIPLLLTGCERLSVAEANIVGMLINLQQSLAAVWTFLAALCYVMGVWFVGLGVLRLKQYGQMTVMMSTQASLGPTLAYVLVGSGLLYLPTLLDTINITLWNYDFNSITAYPAEGSFSDIMIPLLALVQVMGFISFIRGWTTMAKLGAQAQPGTLGKGVMHMIGGVLAMNITGTIDMLHATFFG